LRGNGRGRFFGFGDDLAPGILAAGVMPRASKHQLEAVDLGQLASESIVVVLVLLLLALFGLGLLRDHCVERVAQLRQLVQQRSIRPSGRLDSGWRIGLRVVGLFEQFLQLGD
jgi:hypothetical protein